MGYLTLSGLWLRPRPPPPVLIPAGEHAATSMRHLGASAFGSARSREGEAQPVPATEPHAARLHAPTLCPASGSHFLPPARHLPGHRAASWLVPPCSPYAVNHAQPMRLILSGHTSPESSNRRQELSGAWPRLPETPRAAVGWAGLGWAPRPRSASAEVDGADCPPARVF